MEAGDAIPQVTLTNPDGTSFALADAAAGALGVYFYPRDDTPGCTTEAGDFSALGDAFAAAGVSVIGISRDTPASHVKFAKKHDLTVRLASDADGSVTEAFGVWVEKSMYGRTSMGIERSTFLFDSGGKLAKAWRKVKVAGHAQAVLEAAQAL